MTTYVYPTSAELQLIGQERAPRLAEARPVFSIFPIVEADAFWLIWEQLDNYTGLQQVRGLNGEPPKVQKVGAKRFQAEPGVYGEFIPIDETELTMRRQWGTWDAPVAIDDLVLEAQRQLQVRELDRIETIVWTLLTSGTFSITGATGAIVHTDAYTVQTYTAGVAWSTPATSTPLADFRAVQLLGAGKGVSFDAGARAWMNRVTANRLLSNTNSNDIAGRRAAGLSTINSITGINEILTGEDLPNLMVYDEGYINDAGTFTRFLTDGVVLVEGRRTDGSPVGQYRMTRNVNNMGMGPGSYDKVIDKGEDRVPRQIDVHRGHNGGAVIYWPSAIVKMSV